MAMNIYRWDSKDSPHQNFFKTPDVADQLICYGREVTCLTIFDRFMCTRTVE